MTPKARVASVEREPNRVAAALTTRVVGFAGPVALLALVQPGQATVVAIVVATG
jgi:hypothetical protein